MDLENSLYFSSRTLMVLLCLVAAVASARCWARTRQPLPLAMVSVLVIGTVLAGLDTRENVLLHPTEPISLESWLWLVFDLAVPLLALLALRTMRQRDLALAELARLASTDPLTGLPNRRGFKVQAATALAAARKAGQPMALAMLDIDRFKHVNDAHGHAAGDAVLAGVARTMRAALREHDLPGRWGGEEFVLVLPGTGLSGARTMVERLRAAISAEVAHPDGGEARVTLSAGVAALGGGPPEIAIAAAQQAADVALYRAKAAGRDRVEVAG